MQAPRRQRFEAHGAVGDGSETAHVTERSEPVSSDASSADRGGTALRSVAGWRVTGKSFVRLSVRVGLLVGLAAAFEVWTRRLTRLPEPSYTRPVLAIELIVPLSAVSVVSLVTAIAMIAAGILAWRSRSLGPRWHDLEAGVTLRWLVFGVALLLAWTFATYDYNFYFDQGHHLDRLLLLLLLPAIVWRPVFLFPFIPVVLAIAGQFDYPIQGFSVAAPILPIRVLLLFTAFWTIHAATRRARSADLVFAICWLVATHYWVSGWGKVQLSWLATDHVAYLLPATYANGWLGFLAPETIASITKGLLRINTPLKVATLLVECGALVMLWRKATVQLFLAGAILMHASIWLITGIGFLGWIVLDGLLLFLFFRPKQSAPDIFTANHIILFIGLVLVGPSWLRPTRLAWLDSRATYTYRLEAPGEGGRSYTLSPAFFAPYDYQFTLGAFRYLVDESRLPVTWGAIGDESLEAAVNRATAAQDVFALEARLGSNSFDADRAVNFDRFIQRFVGSWNDTAPRRNWWTPLRAPPLLWTFPRGDPATDGDRIGRVVVWEITSLFDDERYLEIRRVPIRIIDIPE